MTMKTLFLSSFATALLGAMSLSLFADSTVAYDNVRDPVKLRVDVDRTVLPADTTEKVVIKIGLDGVRLPRRELRPPVNIALVIDRSGSMAGDKIACHTLYPC